MFFARVGTIVAWLAFVAGVYRIGMGTYVASFDDAAERSALAARYLGSISSGESIDRGVYTILVAVALGILAEIGRSISRISSDRSDPGD